MARTSGQPVNLLIAATPSLAGEHKRLVTGIHHWPLTIGVP
jgi:hypothetical protein